MEATEALKTSSIIVLLIDHLPWQTSKIWSTKCQRPPRLKRLSRPRMPLMKRKSSKRSLIERRSNLNNRNKTVLPRGRRSLKTRKTTMRKITKRTIWRTGMVRKSRRFRSQKIRCSTSPKVSSSCWQTDSRQLKWLSRKCLARGPKSLRSSRENRTL